MLKVDFSRGAEIQFSSLDEKEKQMIRRWVEKLSGFRPDLPYWTRRVKRLMLEGPETVYLLRTNTEFRLFFKKDAKGITVTDIALQRTLDYFNSRVATAAR
jgi:mRNA-degrading endonuclease RelE of RelBE toxin-antitoxin system